MSRPLELRLLLLVGLIAFWGFFLAESAFRIQSGVNPLPYIPRALLPPSAVMATLLLLHGFLRWRRVAAEPMILPITGLLVALGLTLLWRLRGPAAVEQQLLRGFLPGALAMAAFMARPRLVETIRRTPILISLAGLTLLIATAFFGVVDESGARLSLRLGPLPPIQTAELIKLALIIFLAWYLESEGERIEGRPARLLLGGRLRLPALSYFLPGLLFVSLATLALVKMSDFGAILILGALFVTLLYTGLQPRVFVTVAAIGLILSAVVGLALAAVWQPPAVIQFRLAAYANPWSQEPLRLDGQPIGLTVAEGPGYQIQQAIYATVAGGLTGAGLGFGQPTNVPLAHSDFIFAALVEEMGAAVAIAVLFLFLLLLLRIVRVAVLLPESQLFERLLLAGIVTHLFIQLFVMVGGTLNLLPLTGVTIPFLSQGGVALAVNLAEIGMVLALAQRLNYDSSPLAHR